MQLFLATSENVVCNMKCSTYIIHGFLFCVFVRAVHYQRDSSGIAYSPEQKFVVCEVDCVSWPGPSVRIFVCPR